MKKQQIKAINSLLILLFYGIGALLWFTFFNQNWIALFIILIVSSAIPNLITSFIPTKKKRKKPSQVKAKANTNNRIPPTRLLPDDEIMKLPLEKMSGIEFERLCYMYYKAKGYKPKETSKGADGGVDLLIYSKKDKDYEAVQIKHYSNSGRDITVNPIRELYAAKQNHGCVLARFITTSGYTRDALLQADKWRIETHSGEWVQNKIIKWQKEQTKKKTNIS